MNTFSSLAMKGALSLVIKLLWHATPQEMRTKRVACGLQQEGAWDDIDKETTGGTLEETLSLAQQKGGNSCGYTYAGKYEGKYPATWEKRCHNEPDKLITIDLTTMKVSYQAPPAIDFSKAMQGLDHESKERIRVAVSMR